MPFNSSPEVLPPRWVQWTQVGNVQMQASQWDLALYSYGQAAEIIKKILASDSQDYQSDHVHLYVVSCHNLSDAYIQIKSHVDAHTLLLKAHYQALDWMGDRVCSTAVRYAAYQALQPTVVELMNFYEFTKQPDRITAILTMTQEKVARFLQELNPRTPQTKFEDEDDRLRIFRNN